MTWSDIMRCDEVWYSVICCNTVWCGWSLIWWDGNSMVACWRCTCIVMVKVWCGLTRHGAVWCYFMWCGVLWCLMWYRCYTMRFDMVWYDIWCGCDIVIWHGVWLFWFFWRGDGDDVLWVYFQELAMPG